MIPKCCPACQSERRYVSPSDGPGVWNRFQRLLIQHRHVICLDCGVVLTYMIEPHLSVFRKRVELKPKSSVIPDEL